MGKKNEMCKIETKLLFQRGIILDESVDTTKRWNL